MRTIRRCGMRLGAATFLALAVLLVTSPAANAEFMGNILTVEASSSIGTASQSWEIPAEPSDQLVWTLDGPVEFLGPEDELIGSLDQAVVALDGDPVVSLSFAVGAGGAPTTFTITSATVGFPALTNPAAFASAGVTLTDTEPFVGNGASLNFAKNWNGLYRATYNGGTLFSELLGTQSVAPTGTTSASANSGTQTIAGPVNDIQASFNFTLSANDDASGSSQFEVVPEPSVLAMLIVGLVGMAIGRRR